VKADADRYMGERFESVDVSGYDVPLPLVVTPLDDFAAVDEASAAPLVGGDDDTILAAGGTLVFYGDGGAGKTTLAVDLAFHLAAGEAWLGLPVPRPLNVLVIENEGPRGKFRTKLWAKLAAWAETELEGTIGVLEEPWSLFTFAAEPHREALAARIAEHGYDVVVAGPVQRLGMRGGGTPDEVGAFMLNIELVRGRLEAPLAVVLAHHENKAGDVAGAWEGVPDTLAHVQARGHGATRLCWQKTRWSSSLHGRAWTLLWRDGEGFEIDETAELADDDLVAAILSTVREQPGCSAKVLEDAPAVRARSERVRAIRDQLLEAGKLVDVGRGNGFALYVADDPTLPALTRPDRHESGTSALVPPSRAAGTRTRPSSHVKRDEYGTGRLVDAEEEP
jgi:AAA domain